MKIFFLITGLSMGGAEKVVTSLADALADRGHVVLISYLTGVALVVPRNPAVCIVDLGIKSAKDIFKTYFKLRRLVIDFKPDVVHSHMVHANILARLMRLTTAIPRLICTAHSSNEGGYLRMIAYRVTDVLADLSTNVSDAAVAAFVALKAVKPGRMIAVHNGISTSAFAFSPSARDEVRQRLGIADGCKLILAVGRLTEAKDYPNLLRALQMLNVNSINFKACIAGAGPLEQTLKGYVCELEIGEHVEFLGIRHDVAALLSAADVFVLSSAWEGFGLVVAEAMACECIVVATDCGGVKEIVGDCGYLVPRANSRALCAAICKAFALSTCDAKTLRMRAKKRIISNYSLETTIRKWLLIYSPNK
jgi:glycosyltransferase involved in cell wall biosynthesis